MFGRYKFLILAILVIMAAGCKKKPDPIIITPRIAVWFLCLVN